MALIVVRVTMDTVLMDHLVQVRQCFINPLLGIVAESVCAVQRQLGVRTSYYLAIWSEACQW